MNGLNIVKEYAPLHFKAFIASRFCMHTRLRESYSSSMVLNILLDLKIYLRFFISYFIILNIFLDPNIVQHNKYSDYTIHNNFLNYGLRNLK